ncbi:hypothetical protein LguiB_032015 [Lonicera macranthoides]
MYTIFLSVSFVECIPCEELSQSIVWMGFESFAYLDINDVMLLLIHTHNEIGEKEIFLLILLV